MCGIVGVIAKAPVNQLIYDALLLLQHRGQDAAGIVTMEGTKCFMQKARGMVRDVFRTRNMRALPGRVGLGQVRYPTAGNAWSEEEAVAHMVQQKGRHFDPALVDLFIGQLPALREIRQRWAEATAAT